MMLNFMADDYVDGIVVSVVWIVWVALIIVSMREKCKNNSWLMEEASAAGGQTKAGGKSKCDAA